MPNQTCPLIAYAALALELKSAGGRVHLLPDGLFSAVDGRPAECEAWKLDAEIAARLIAQSASRKGKRVVDYEHATLKAKASGQPAPAAGWWTGLEYESGVGLFATRVEWTERAAAMIAAGEYRYASAVYPYDPATGAVLDILHFSLTNDPALDGLDPVSLAAASQILTPIPEPYMQMPELMERLCYLLNLPLTTTPTDMVAQLDKLKGLLSANPTAAASLITGLGPVVAELSAKASAAPDPARFVPFATYQAAQARIAELSARLFEAQVEPLWLAAEADGRITALNREYVESVKAKGSLAELTACLDALAPIAALSGMQTGGCAPPRSPVAALDAAESAICAALGLSVEDYLKTKTEGQP